MKEPAAPTGAITVEAVSDVRAFRALEGIWNDLLARSGSDSPFLTFEWLASWWETFGADRGLLLLLARKNGSIIGLAPLMKHRLFIPGCRALGVEFIGAPDADYHDFIILQDREETIRGFLRSVFQVARAPILRLSEFPEHSPNFEPLNRVLLDEPDVLARRRIKTLCYFLPLDPELSWEAQFRRLKLNMRTNLKRLLNRYQERGQPILTEIAAGQLNENLTELYHHHGQRWRRSGRHARMRRGAQEQFLQILGERFLSKGWLHFTRLDWGDRGVGFHYGFRYRGTYYYYLVAYDRAYARYSPGKVHLYFLLRWAHQAGFAVLDLLRGREPYKTSWTDCVRKNHELVVFRRDLGGMGFYFWFEGVKPLFRRLGVARLLGT